MNGPTLTRRILKARAKRTIARFSRPCIAAACLLLAFTVLARAFSVYAGGALYYLMLDIRQFPMETGLWRADPTLMTTLMSMLGLERLGDLGGMVFALSDAVSGLVIVLPVAWRQLINLVVIQGIVFLVTVPLQYGVLTQFRSILEGRPAPFRSVLRWYLDLHLTGKALAVQVLLTLWQWAARLVCMVPGLLCLIAASAFPNGEWMLLLSSSLSILGMLGGYYLYMLLLPARYLLAQSPGLSVRQALSRGFRLLTGRRGDYFKLNLSFLPLQVLSMVLWNIPNLYLVPYMELSNYLFLDPPPDPEAPPVALKRTNKWGGGFYKAAPPLLYTCVLPSICSPPNWYSYRTSTGSSRSGSSARRPSCQVITASQPASRPGISTPAPGSSMGWLRPLMRTEPSRKALVPPETTTRSIGRDERLYTVTAYSARSPENQVRRWASTSTKWSRTGPRISSSPSRRRPPSTASSLTLPSPRHSRG